MMSVERCEVVISRERAANKDFVQITNIETGEIIDQFWKERRKSPSGRPPGGKKPHFYKLYCTNWQDIVKRKHLTPYEAGVFFMCLSFVGWESNFLRHPKTGNNLSCNQIAGLLGIDQAQLFRVLQVLCNKGLLAVVKFGDGRANHYMLNSNVVFWGNRIKDASEHARFVQDCPYEPPIVLKYQESGGK